MSAAEEEPSSSVNGRLRPRRAAVLRTGSQERRKASAPNKTALELPSNPEPSLLCPYCDKTFGSKQAVTKHVLRLHLSIPNAHATCLFCSHSEVDVQLIIRHMVDSHPNQYFACLDCLIRLPSTSDLAEHKLICDKQKLPYRSKLRRKASLGTLKKTKKSLEIDDSDDYENDDKDYQNHGFNGMVISCELKPAQVHDEADIEDKITTNLILPPSKVLVGSGPVLEKSAVLVLDEVQWNKRIPPNFSFPNTDADQILSRLGVVHRSPRAGDRRDWLRFIEDTAQKFEKCFDTSFYSRVTSNVQENLTKFLDGTLNFNPDSDTIKTRKSKNSVVINTAEGFPILLAFQQFTRGPGEGYIPRAIAPKHKWKWDSIDNDRNLISADQIKRDSHTNNCIITFVSGLDIWTQLRMRKKYEEVFGLLKKADKLNDIGRELKEILESREIPSTSKFPPVEHIKEAEPGFQPQNKDSFPGFLGLVKKNAKPDSQVAVLSGEWSRPRCYICGACGAKNTEAKQMTAHVVNQHPNANVHHYEVVGETLLNDDILKHLYVPPSQIVNRTRPPRGFRECTKCKKSISLEELHQHMLDCAGDTPAVRRKVRQRPFGVRRRRPRLPDNTNRKNMRKYIRTRHQQKNHLRRQPKIRSEVGDAETIRKMIADLPPKRHRSLNPVHSLLRPGKKHDKQRNQLLLKRRASEDSKMRRLRSSKESFSIGKKSTRNELRKTANKDDDDDKPLKTVVRASAAKKNQTESNKRKIVMKRPKRQSVLDKKRNINSEEKHSNTVRSIKVPVNQLSIGSSDRKINFSDSSQASGGQRTRGGGNSRDGDNSGTGPQRNNTNNNNNSNNNNNNNGPPPHQIPLKHSIASLTANSETHDKSVQFHQMFLVQQECNIADHVPTGHQLLFENEAIVTRLDKPPIHYARFSVDNSFKNKPSKPHRKGLNDCIAMLKNKLGPETAPASGHISVQCGSDEPIDFETPLPNLPMIEARSFMPTTIKENLISTNETKETDNINTLNTSDIRISPNKKEMPLISVESLLSEKVPEAAVKTIGKTKREPKNKQKSIEQSPPPLRESLRSRARKTKTEKEIPKPIEHEPVSVIPPVSPAVSQKPTRSRRETKQRPASEQTSPLKTTPPPKATSPTPLPIQQQKMPVEEIGVQQSKQVQSEYSSSTSKENNQRCDQTEMNMPNTAPGTHTSLSLAETQPNNACAQCDLLEKELSDGPPDYIENAQDQPSAILVYNNNYSIRTGIPQAHASTSLETYMPAPLDLSGKYIVVNQTLQPETDCSYMEDYDDYGTLDLSNKNCDRFRSPSDLTTYNMNMMNEDVVDLRVNSRSSTIDQSYLDMSGTSGVNMMDVTDLSLRHENDFPTDLSIKKSNIVPQVCKDSCCDYVQDLTGRNYDRGHFPTIPGADDYPTDLSGKSNYKSTSTAATKEKVHRINNDPIEKPKNDVLPTKTDKNAIAKDCEVIGKHIEILRKKEIKQLTETKEEKKESITEADDKVQQYKLREVEKTTTETVTRACISPPKSNNTPTSLTSSLSPIAEPTNYSSNIIPHVSNYSALSHNTSITRELIPYSIGTPINTIVGSLPAYSLPTVVKSTTHGKGESTTAVYTLANTCIPITKIETSVQSTLTNTLLSIPGTTIASTTSVYTLAGTTTQLEFGPLPDATQYTASSSIKHKILSAKNDSNFEARSYSLDGFHSNNNSKPIVHEENQKEVKCMTEDIETAKKIAMLPKELVEILGTMPADHRKQLLNVLPQYVSTSTARSMSGVTHTITSSTSSINIAKPKITVEKRQSMSISEDPVSEVFSKKQDMSCQTQLKVQSTSLDSSTKKPLTTAHSPSTSTLSKEKSIRPVVADPFSHSMDIKTSNGIIDLTDDDCEPMSTDFISPVKVNYTLPTNLPPPDSTDSSSAVKSNQQKISNEKTASLRAVRIKTPSERQKRFSADNQIVNKVTVEDTPKPASALAQVDYLSLKKASEICKVQIKEPKKSDKKDENISKANDSTLLKETINEKTKINNLKNKNDDFKSVSNSNSVPMEVDLDKTDLVSKTSPVNVDNCTQDFNDNYNKSLTIDKPNNKVNNDVNKSVDNLNYSQLIEKSIIPLTTSTPIQTSKERVSVNDTSNKKLSNKFHDEDDSEDDISLATIVKQKQLKSKTKVSIDDDSKTDLSSTKKSKKIKKTKKSHDLHTGDDLKLIKEHTEHRCQNSNSKETENKPRKRPRKTRKICNYTSSCNDHSKLTRDLEVNKENDHISTEVSMNKKNIEKNEVDEVVSELKESNDNSFHLSDQKTDGIVEQGHPKIKNIIEDIPISTVLNKENAVDKNNKEQVCDEIDLNYNCKKPSSSLFENETQPISNHQVSLPSESIKSAESDNTHNSGEKHSQISTISALNKTECSENTDSQDDFVSQTDKKVTRPKKSKGVEFLPIKDDSLLNESTCQTVTPLRRSRRGKSLFVEGAYADYENSQHNDSIDYRSPITKKQLIFSKLLLDEECSLKPGEGELLETNVSENIDTSIDEFKETDCTAVDDCKTDQDFSLDKINIKKRKKSQCKRKLKKVKSLDNSQNIEESKTSLETDKQLDETDVEKPHSASTSEIDEKLPNEVEPVLNDSIKVSVIINDLSSSSGKRKSSSLTEESDSHEKQTKSKQPKLDESSTTKEQNTICEVTSEKSIATTSDNIIQEPDIEQRTTCYNTPTAARRTRSKSVVVKSSLTDYDPYDIDYDELAEKCEPMIKRGKSSTEGKSSGKTKNSEISTKKSRKYEAAEPLDNRPSKSTDEFISDRGNISDSDASSKSDIPLKKYVEGKEKKIAEEKLEDQDNNPDISSEKCSKSSKNSRRTLAVCNNVESVTTQNESEEELRSEQFMESFGFFSERKPRKSNLLASKKISETFHIIANESEDSLFTVKERTNKRTPQNENRKASETAAKVQHPPIKKGKRGRKKSRKNSFLQFTPCYCNICKKEFRRPDNYLRHQMTLHHVSKLSEIEMKMKTTPVPEEPNYLIVYKQQLDRLKMLKDKLSKKRKHSKTAPKIVLPTLEEILVNVNKTVREQQLARMGLSRDEALFLDCCELLKESHNVDPRILFSEVTIPGLVEIRKYDNKSDGDVDSITAKSILESDEVKNLEKDLISGLKKAATATFVPSNYKSPETEGDNITSPSTSDCNLPQNNSNNDVAVENSDSAPVKIKKLPEVKEKMYPDITLEDIDMFEDKFDKIKRKCRSQAAAAAKSSAVVESTVCHKSRKKSEKKKTKKISKKNLQNTVLTKGALKGFDGIKVSIPTSDINISAIVTPLEKNRKKIASKKKKEKPDGESGKYEGDRCRDSNSSHANVDVYEFMDNEDAELFEFRPSTLMERFKSMSNNDGASTSKAQPVAEEPEDSSSNPSESDDFVYMSDDYVCSDDETENSLASYDCGAGKIGLDVKKTVSPTKRKDVIEKNAVMGKIFKNNAVRTEKKQAKPKETTKLKANLDQLFDSLLEEEPSSSMLNDEDTPPLKDDSEFEIFDSHKPKDDCCEPKSESYKDDFATPQKLKTKISKKPDYETSPVYSQSNSPLQNDPEDFYDFGPSTSKASDIQLKKPHSPKKTDSEKCNDETKRYSSESPDHDMKRLKNTKESVVERSEEQDVEEDAGVARQRARRKCTVGKQNVLAETWSSESEADGIPARNSGDRRRQRRREKMRPPHRRHELATSPQPGPSSVRPRSRAPGFFFPGAEDAAPDTDHQPQHGWIVGDSHKKLVTMLAHAKGRKRHHDEKRHLDE